MLEGGDCSWLTCPEEAQAPLHPLHLWQVGKAFSGFDENALGFRYAHCRPKAMVPWGVLNPSTCPHPRQHRPVVTSLP